MMCNVFEKIRYDCFGFALQIYSKNWQPKVRFTPSAGRPSPTLIQLFLTERNTSPKKFFALPRSVQVHPFEGALPLLSPSAPPLRFLSFPSPKVACCGVYTQRVSGICFPSARYMLLRRQVYTSPLNLHNALYTNHIESHIIQAALKVCPAER